MPDRLLLADGTSNLLLADGTSSLLLAVQTITGTAVGAFAFTATATGIRTVTGSAVGSYAFSATARGRVLRPGVDIGVAVVGNRTMYKSRTLLHAL